jgi:DNA-binding transcriptional LysR family regulator
LDLRSLRHLLTVQEAGSLNKAAAQIGVSQPALSKIIHRLEAEIGAPLFERQSRGVRPTIYGSRLLEFARATCVAFDRSLAELRDIKSGATGAVTIYGPPLVAGQLFPEIFSAVKLRFPNLRLRFEVQVDHLVEALMDGKADLVVGTLTSETLKQSVQCLPLFEEDLVLICKRGHPVTRLKPLTAKGLSEFDWVFSAPGNRHRNKLERFFEAAGVPIPRPLAETSSPALIRSLVMARMR